MLEHYLVSLVTAAKAKALVPVATVRTELGLSDSSQDAKLTRLIAALGAAFAGQQGLQRPLLRQTYLERTNGVGGVLLPLHRWPVESVASVTEGVTNPSTIDAAEYAIALEGRSALYRANGWARTACVEPVSIVGGSELYTYAATYTAGWLPPGDGAGLVETWSGAKARLLASWAKPAAPANGDNALLFECTVAGTTGASEPTWPTTAGATVVDGSATWTARQAQELPADIQEVALITAMDWYGGALRVPAGIARESFEGGSIDYDTSDGRLKTLSLPPAARGVLLSYR